MKTIILYNSQTGFTKHYAEWIAEAAEADCIELSAAKKKDLTAYEAIVFGSWACAGSISKISWFKGNIDKWAGKKLIVFCVGASPIENPEVEIAIKMNHMQIRIFCQRGSDDRNLPCLLYYGYGSESKGDHHGDDVRIYGRHDIKVPAGVQGDRLCGGGDGIPPDVIDVRRQPVADQEGRRHGGTVQCSGAGERRCGADQSWRQGCDNCRRTAWRCRQHQYGARCGSVVLALCDRGETHCLKPAANTQ